MEALPDAIETLENEKQQLLKTLNSPELYTSRDLTKINIVNDRLKNVDEDLDKSYHRWDELEAMARKFEQDM
ncbi:MAG TPA: hypothetical protein VHO84_03360 [Syntrophorhabdaceae bacterium]|nr:hypothetical protein [Syntrophorhabdaceae bacterium]